MTDNKLYELEKWAKYGKLMSGLIHNLNTPLMGLSGRIELLEMKYPDIKGIENLTKHVDTLSNMLKASAYFTDKDANDKEYDTDLHEFIERFDMFMKAHMKYKHGLFVEKELIDVNILMNPQRYFNAMYIIIDYILDFTGEEDTFTYKNDDKQLSLVFNSGSGVYSINNNDFEPIFQTASKLLEEIGKTIKYKIDQESLEIVFDL